MSYGLVQFVLFSCYVPYVIMYLSQQVCVCSLVYTFCAGFAFENANLKVIVTL